MINIIVIRFRKIEKKFFFSLLQFFKIENVHGHFRISNNSFFLSNIFFNYLNMHTLYKYIYIYCINFTLQLKRST